MGSLSPPELGLEDAHVLMKLLALVAYLTSCTLLTLLNTAVNFHLTYVPGKGLEAAQWVARWCQQLWGACQGPQRCPTREGRVVPVPHLQHGGLNAHNPTDTVPEQDPRLAAGWPRACCQGGMKFPTFVLDPAFCPSSPPFSVPHMP